MPQPQLQPPQSIETFDLAQTPIQPTLSSEQADWKQLLARRAHLLDSPIAFSLPGFTNDHLLIQLTNEIWIQGKVERPFQRLLSGPGNVYVIPRGMPTEWHWSGSCDILALFLPPALIAQVAIEAIDTDPASIEIVERIATRDPLIYHIALAILRELENPGWAGQVYIETLSHALVVHLIREHAVFAKYPLNVGGQLSTLLLRHVLDYINDNLNQDLSLAELAASVHLSPYHFARMFKQSTGFAPHRYIIQCRVKRAEQMLANGKHNIAEVAQQVGFTDHSHLTRHFRQVLGITPSAFRQNSKNIQKTRKEIQD